MIMNDLTSEQERYLHFFYSSEKSYPTMKTNLKPQSFIQNVFEQDYSVKDYWLYLISK